MGTSGGGWESSFSIVSDSQSRKAKMEIDFIIVQENSQEASVPARRRPHRDRARRQPAALSADQAGRPRPRRSPSPYSASKSWLRPPRPSTTFSVAARPRSRLWSSLSYTSALPRPGRAGGGKNQFASVAKQALVRARAARNRNKKKKPKISWRESLVGNRIRSWKPCGPRRKLKRACIGEQHQNRGR